MNKIIPIMLGISLGLASCEEPTYREGLEYGYREGIHNGELQIEYYMKQLPNWNPQKFYNWSGGYEGQSEWQMAIDDLKENYIHKDSCLNLK